MSLKKYTSKKILKQKKQQLINCFSLNSMGAAVVLLDSSNINIVNKDGDTLLHWAIKNNNAELAQLIIDKGIDISIKNNNGKTALCSSYVYIVKTHENQPINSLHTEKVDIDECDGADNTTKNTALHLAAATAYADKTITSLLGDNNKNINEQDIGGNTPLHWDVQNNATENAQFLIKKEADINVKNNKGEAPLELAITKYNYHVVENMLETMPDVDDVKKINIVEIATQALKQATEQANQAQTEYNNNKDPNKHGDAIYKLAYVNNAQSILKSITDKFTMPFTDVSISSLNNLRSSASNAAEERCSHWPG